MLNEPCAGEEAAVCRPPPAVLRLTNVLGYSVLVILNIVLATEVDPSHNNAAVSEKYHTPLTPSGCVLVAARRGSSMYSLLAR